MTTKNPAISSMSDSEWQGALKEGFESEAEIVSLDEGEGFFGHYLGNGPVVESKDPKSGEVRPLTTHEFDLGGGNRVALMGCYQLDKYLPEHVNDRVAVKFMGKVTRNGRQINQYQLAAKATKAKG